mmetsp:Transcript_42689/g.49059  ORF Transcript_42689/g.49059 Transcript_42689/m.49059 type:complete len:263 (+) Transcript_42689:53-841(+)
MRDHQHLFRGMCNKCDEGCVEFLHPDDEEVKVTAPCKTCKCAIVEHRVVELNPRESQSVDLIRDVFDHVEISEIINASINDTIRLNISREFLTYGEINELAFPAILRQAKPQPGEVFYDLGTGSGKPAILACALFPFAKAIGIELLPTVTEIANRMAKRYEQLRGKYELTEQSVDLEFKCQDLLQSDFSEADVIYIASTCFDIPFMEKISARSKDLKPGTRIITLKNPMPSLGEQNIGFELIHDKKYVMSWGWEHVYVQVKL